MYLRLPVVIRVEFCPFLDLYFKGREGKERKGKEGKGGEGNGRKGKGGILSLFRPAFYTLKFSLSL